MNPRAAHKENQSFDIIVIGAGPAGMMAAIESYRQGRGICILEKMPLPALKLKISGKGRCNITNAATREEFLRHFGKQGRFLKASFAHFFNTDLLQYLQALGVEFKLERGGRYFPQSDSAHEIAEALLNRIKELGIPILTRTNVTDISRLPDGSFRLSAANPKHQPAEPIQAKTLYSKNVVLASGGKSYPKTGSDGSGYALAQRLGHTVTPLFPSLVALYTEGDTAKKLEGLALKNVNVTLWINHKKASEQFGEMVFTDAGVSGPVILSLSRDAVKPLDSQQSVSISIDLKPALDHSTLEQRLLREIRDHNRRQMSSLLEALLPRKMIAVFVEILSIAPDKPLHQLNTQERKQLRLLLKDFRMRVTGHPSFDDAIVTSGGISLAEIDSQTLQSKIVPGLYFAGEVLDLDADTGGFNLQAAFSTGWLAGRSLQGWEPNCSGPQDRQTSEEKHK